MIEQLYLEVVQKLQQYLESINKTKDNEVQQIEDIFKQIILRIDFCLKPDGESKVLDKRLLREMKKFSKSIFISTKNSVLYSTKTQRSIDRLAWINLKYNINTSARSYTVAQREVFFANLGDNIGSEQNGRRPVIILQNNIGNRKGNTTIIAPITTHNKGTHYDEKSNRYYVEKKDEDGKMYKKYLGSYEIPLKLDEDGIYGFINIIHLREIDRKRINSGKVGVATKKCFNEVIAAIIRNLQE